MGQWKKSKKKFKNFSETNENKDKTLKHIGYNKGNIKSEVYSKSNSRLKMEKDCNKPSSLKNLENQQ